jgi:hypothetical protein
VVAQTVFTNHPDSGSHGEWALDNFTRQMAITAQAQVSSSHCGGAPHCWFFTGTTTDNGSFTTEDGALSPHAGVPISGVLSGDFSGGATFELYSTQAPDASLVAAAADGGSAPSTSGWVTKFFPSGTTYGVNLPTWSWTYGNTSTCETWVDASTVQTGDIVGVNACS